MSDDLDTKGLDNLIKALGEEQPIGRIGVLGNGNQRKDENSNAEIGAKHEFGDDKLPIRSWLRMPLIDKMQDALDSSGAFDKEASRQVVQEKSVTPWLKKVMIVAEGVVLDAFATGGFGKWKPSNMKYKKNHQTLVETQQLRNSVTSEVKE